MPTKITYNGKTTELADGYIATLPCKDLKMETDVAVEAPEAVEVPTVEEWDGTGVVIEGLVKLISFTIDGTSYQAVDGMTWAEWVESDYNPSPNGIVSGSTYIAIGGSYVYATSSSVMVKPTDVISQSDTYYTASNEPV